MKKYFFLTMYLCALFITVNAQSWSITGNTGTNPSTNFLGTTDNNPLLFKTNNSERMRIKGAKIGIGLTNPQQKLDVNGDINLSKGSALFMENHPVLRVDSINANIFLGNGAGFSTTSAFYNTAAGYQTLYATTYGSFNTGYGSQALRFNTSGGYNTATGSYAMRYNSSGSDNTATGYASMYSNSTGSYNSAYGESALSSNTTGNNNSAYGFRALYYNNDGYDNVANGYSALYKNTSGYWNTAIGREALYANTSGSSNTAVGGTALYSNTTGYGNTATGNNALTVNTTGIYNTAYGIEALLYNSGGSFNTATGTDALYNNTTSYYNCAYGYLALAFVNPGYNNTAVGSFAGPAVDLDGIYNTISLGTSAVTTASNQARIGNSSTTSIGGYTNWTNISDGRVKKNIKTNVPGLAFINKLKPVTYNLDLDAADRITQNITRKDKQGKTIAPLQQEINARNAKQQIVYTGFVAQDVEKVAKELNYDFSGVDAAKNDRDLYGLRYAEFVVPLVKAVQELSNINEEKDAKIEALQNQNDALEKRLEKIEATLNMQSSNSSLQSSANISLSRSSLEQNIPNPFHNTTTINYTLPKKYSSAKIIITDKSGKALKEINISGSGNNSMRVDASTLSSGTYQYSLYVDGKLINTKQMVLTK